MNASIITFKQFSLGLIVASLLPLGILSLATNIDIILMAGIVGGITLWICVYEQGVFCKYFSSILSCVWTLIDIYVLENAVTYLPNLYEYSYRTGCLYLLILGYVAYICALVFFDRRHQEQLLKIQIQKNIDRISKRIFAIITIGLFLLMFVALLDAFRSGYFASGSSSRYSYAQSAGREISFFYNIFRIFLPVVAIYSYVSQNSKYVLSFTGLYLVFLILTGNKFGALLMAINIAFIAFVFPFSDYGSDLKPIINKALKALLLACVVLLAYSIFQSILEKGSIEQAVDHIFDRVITGQGDVWWGTYAAFGNNSPHFSEIGDELQAFTASQFNQDSYHFAIYKLMRLIAPSSVVTSYAEIGARFTASTDASFFYYFGAIGVVLGRIFIAWIMSKVTNGLICACRSLSVVGVLCFGVLYNYALRAGSMSELYLFLTPLALICYLAILFSRQFNYEETNLSGVNCDYQ